MKIAVINLASNAARWQAVQRQFDAVGLAPMRLDAVSGDELTLGEINGLYSELLNRRQYHKPLRSGEIGCYASHIRAWRRLLQSGDSCLAIFEDDIEISVDLPEVLESVADTVAEWDVVKLIGRPIESIERARPLLPGRRLIAYRRVPSLTGAYVVSRRGAAKLLQARLPFGRPVDVDMRHWWECDLRIAGVHPYPARPGPSSRHTTIPGRRFRTDATMRLHKLRLQASYTFRNWCARWFGAGLAPLARMRDSALAGADGRLPVREAPVRHDAT